MNNSGFLRFLDLPLKNLEKPAASRNNFQKKIPDHSMIQYLEWFTNNDGIVTVLFKYISGDTLIIPAGIIGHRCCMIWAMFLAAGLTYVNQFQAIPRWQAALQIIQAMG